MRTEIVLITLHFYDTEYNGEQLSKWHSNYLLSHGHAHNIKIYIYIYAFIILHKD